MQTAFDELGMFRAIADAGVRALLVGRQAIARDEQRRLSPAESEARVRVPMSEREREDFHTLIQWFTTRYPTAGDRMRAIRRRMLALRARER